MKFLVIIVLIVAIALVVLAVMDVSRRMRPKPKTRTQIVAEDRRRMLSKMYADNYNDFTAEGESLRAAIEEELGPIAITKLREELNK